MKNALSIVWVVAAVLLLLAAGTRHGPLVTMRQDYRLASVAPLENAPPLMAFTTVALAGFSSIVADVLWYRVGRLQEEGRYFEIVQLSDWITKLEPRCADIWIFHAWNMTYNVSVMMPTPDDRWRWVRNGLDLLRDEGLRYNAGDAKIHSEIAWIYLNKIGGVTDTANLFYKQRWALEMTDLLGGAHPDFAALESQPAALRRLREQYRLDPAAIREADNTYGPLDWRTAQAHAVYWAMQGKARSANDRNRRLTCDRTILYALSGLARDGRLLAVDGPDGVQTGPDLDLIPKVLKAYRAAFDAYRDPTIKTGYENFLKEAIVILHAYRRTDDARTLFAELSPGASPAAFEALVRDFGPDVSFRRP